MIKVQALLTRRPDLSLEEFDRHWHRPHGDPLTLALTVVRFALQNSRVAAAGDLSTAPYDGIPQVWFDTVSDAVALADDPAYPASEADQAHFMDTGTLAFLMTEEHAVDGEVGPGDGAGVNVLQLVKRRVGTSPEAFGSAWPGSADCGHGRALGGMRHIVSRSLPLTYADGDPPFDAVRELFFPDLETALAAPTATPQAWGALFAADAVDAQRSRIFVATQRRLR